MHSTINIQHTIQILVSFLDFGCHFPNILHLVKFWHFSVLIRFIIYHQVNSFWVKSWHAKLKAMWEGQWDAVFWKFDGNHPLTLHQPNTNVGISIYKQLFSYSSGLLPFLGIMPNVCLKNQQLWVCPINGFIVISYYRLLSNENILNQYNITFQRAAGANH